MLLDRNQESLKNKEVVCVRNLLQAFLEVERKRRMQQAGWIASEPLSGFCESPQNQAGIGGSGTRWQGSKETDGAVCQTACKVWRI